MPLAFTLEDPELFRVLEPLYELAREGSTLAIWELSRSMTVGKGRFFNSIAPNVLSLLYDYHPSTLVFDDNDPRLIFVVELLDSVHIARDTVLGEEGRQAPPDQYFLFPALMGRLDILSEIYIFLADHVADAYQAQAEDLSDTDAFRWRVFHLLQYYTTFNFKMAYGTDNLKALYENRRYMIAMLRLWTAEVIVLDPLRHTSLDSPLNVTNFCQTTSSVGGIFWGSYDDPLTDYGKDIPSLRPELFIKPFIVSYGHRAGDIDMLLGAVRMLGSAEALNFDQLSPNLQAQFVGYLVKCLRLTMMKVLPRHFTVLHSEVRGFVRKLHTLIKITGIMLGQCMRKGHDELRPALVAEALHAGIMPTMRRMLYLGQCPCETAGCPWARANIENEEYPYLDGSPRWDDHLRRIVNHFRFSGTDVYKQYEASYKRWMKDDIEACKQPGILTPVVCKSWEQVHDGYLADFLEHRLEFSRLPQHLCQGPECSAPPRLYVEYKRCTGCLVALYCSRECQKRHWKNGHASECGETAYLGSKYVNSRSIFDVKYEEWLRDLGRDVFPWDHE